LRDFSSQLRRSSPMSRKKKRLHLLAAMATWIISRKMQIANF
jgi:hypothetical protein